MASSQRCPATSPSVWPLSGDIEELLMSDNPVDETPVGLRSAKNDRRRTMESILVLLADPGVREYVAEMKRLGLVTPKG
jgi:hypothetical protein